MTDRRVGKLLSWVLRHEPEAVGVALDPNGWIEVDALVDGLAAAGRPVSAEEVLDAVRTDDKRRFELTDGRIRAAQGHSVDIDLGLSSKTPPAVLFHGTAEGTLESIRREGLEPRGRTHVHLSSDESTARRVGSRHGRPVVLRVDAAGMAAGGIEFWQSSNGVWLVEVVAPEWLRFPD